VLVVEFPLVLVAPDDVLVDDDEDTDGCTLNPQNCTFEMSGVFLWCSPTFGRPAFEKVPESCGGVIDVNTDEMPPFTMIPDTATVEVHDPPDADVPVSVTTCSLPDGFSNLYEWS
jgi:hypothetical protein